MLVTAAGMNPITTAIAVIVDGSSTPAIRAKSNATAPAIADVSAGRCCGRFMG